MSTEERPKKLDLNRNDIAQAASRDQAAQLQRGGSRLHAGSGHDRGKRCMQCKKPRCVSGCPVEIDIPGSSHSSAREISLPASSGSREELPACGLRTCLPAGEPVRIAVYPEEQRSRVCHRKDRAFSCRLGSIGGCCRDSGAAEVHGEEGLRWSAQGRPA